MEVSFHCGADPSQLNYARSHRILPRLQCRLQIALHVSSGYKLVPTPSFTHSHTKNRLQLTLHASRVLWPHDSPLPLPPHLQEPSQITLYHAHLHLSETLYKPRFTLVMWQSLMFPLTTQHTNMILCEPRFTLVM